VRVHDLRVDITGPLVLNEQLFEERSGERSRQSHSAHHTEQVTVHYRWHPLHGQTIRVRRSVRHGRDVWLCEQDAAAIPVWMTDCVACAALSTGPVVVSVEALAELASLATPLGMVWPLSIMSARVGGPSRLSRWRAECRRRVARNPSRV